MSSAGSIDTQSRRVGVLVVSAEVTNRSAQAQQYSSAGSQLPLPPAAQFLAQFDCENGGYLKLAIPLGNLMLSVVPGRLRNWKPMINHWICG